MVSHGGCYTPGLRRAITWGAWLALLAALMTDAQTVAFYWDEGFHLLAARAIAQGQRPYLDFCFPQAPLNAYWTAAWFRLFHPSWRLAQGLAACETWLALLLLGGYVRRRFPVPEWRAAAEIVTVSTFGLLLVTFNYGTIAQAYGFCLLTLVAAFRCAVAARERPGAGMAFAAGLLAGAASSASLLAAMAPPVLLAWLWISGKRAAKAAAFAAGCAIPAIPIFRSLAVAPRQTWFNLVQYHAAYRQAGWTGIPAHDVGIATQWLLSSQGALLATLALGRWRAQRTPEHRLCLGLAAAMAAQNLLAHPTFVQYFLLTLPFLAVPAAAGFYAVVRYLPAAKRPTRAAAALACFCALALARGLYGERDGPTWAAIAPAAAKVAAVTPRGAELLAPEAIYFLAGLPAPPEMIFQFTQELDFGAATNALLHILPKAEVDREIRAGRFATAAVCEDDDRVAEIAATHVYSQKLDAGDCTVFWNRR
jgi:hypothetical protein